MKFCRFVPWLTVLVLAAGCAPDRALEALIPRQALAVVLVERPGLVVSNLGPAAGTLPWGALDGSRPWAAVVVPGSPPRFRLFLALGSSPGDWDTVVRWAATTGGLVADSVGGYAVLSMPGMGPVTPLAVAERFDASGLRGDGRLAGAYLDASVLPGSPIPGLKDQLRGVFLGIGPRSGGLEVSLRTDWRPRSPWQKFLSGVRPRASWSGWFPGRPSSGLAVALNLPPQVWSLAGLSVADPGFQAWWAALSPQLGPRAAFVAEPAADKGWSWRTRVEASDPQAVRQALKTLVAGGVLQRQFPVWALDPDTPVIYQDQKDDVVTLLTRVSVGDRAMALAYGRDFVSAAGGPGAVAAARQGVVLSGAPPGVDLPNRTLVAIDGTLDGLSASGTVSAETDGNLTLRVFVDAASLGAWEDRLPQALRQWAASSTLGEP